jgi:hypothetical protein
MLEQKRFPRGHWQTLQRFPQRAPELTIDVVGSEVFDVSDGDSGAPHVFEMIQTEIARDAENPRPEVSRIAALVEACVSFDESVLHYVETGVVIEPHAARMPVQRILMTTHQLGVRIPFAAQNARYQVSIGDGWLVQQSRRHS